jgi:hypothetical protein
LRIKIFWRADGSTYQPPQIIHNHHGRKKEEGSKEDDEEGSKEDSEEGSEEALVLK